MGAVWKGKKEVPPILADGTYVTNCPDCGAKLYFKVEAGKLYLVRSEHRV